MTSEERRHKHTTPVIKDHLTSDEHVGKDELTLGSAHFLGEVEGREEAPVENCCEAPDEAGRAEREDWCGCAAAAADEAGTDGRDEWPLSASCARRRTAASVTLGVCCGCCMSDMSAFRLAMLLPPSPIGLRPRELPRLASAIREPSSMEPAVPPPPSSGDRFATGKPAVSADRLGTFTFLAPPAVRLDGSCRL